MLFVLHKNATFRGVGHLPDLLLGAWAARPLFLRPRLNLQCLAREAGDLPGLRRLTPQAVALIMRGARAVAVCKIFGTLQSQSCPLRRPMLP